MKRYLVIAAGLAIPLLSGCMVGPKYVKPSAPLAPGFKERPTGRRAMAGRPPNPTRTCCAESGENSTATQS
jgi:hypothetical protein